MYVSPAQAPYAGVYERQPTGLPKAEYIPQYPQMAFQANGINGPMYVPQNESKHDQMLPPSYEQSQQNYPSKKKE